MLAAAAIGYDLGQQPETYPRYENPRDDKAGANATARENIAAERYKYPCRNPQGQGESDLCAQYRAANNAGRAARWAFWQFLLSVFGVVGLGLTIFLTIRATNAAVESNRIARDTAAKQLRAYIGVLGAKAFYVGAPLSRVVIEIKNYGQTPAFDVTSHTGLYIGTHQTEFPGNGDIIFVDEFGIVEPGQERVIWINLPEAWISENFKALSAGEVRLFSETRIQYSDVGGVSRHRGFNCYLPRLRNANARDPGVRMTITAGGNVDSWVGRWAEEHQAERA